MGKLEICLTGKIYEVKRQYPFFLELGKRMNVVKKELNKELNKEEMKKK